MRTSPRNGGFTLAEMMVGLVVTSIVMIATTSIFIAVQNSYQAETEVMNITQSGRGAILFLERVIPLAGYGVDPRVAFDTSNTAGATVITRDNAAVAGTGGGVTDDLAFRYRDPAFLRAGRFIAGSVVLSSGTLGIELPANKLVMVGCGRGGTPGEYRMYRTQATVAAGATTFPVTAAAAPFAASSDTCFTDADEDWIFLVHEHRLRIHNIGGRPWLVSFRDLTADPGTSTNFDPIAPDVEGFQIAFGMNRARPTLSCCQTAPDVGGNANWIVGDTTTEALFNQSLTGIWLKATMPLPYYDTGYDDPSRYQLLPGNIRSVHVALVVRSSRTDPTGKKGTQSGTVFNYAGPTATDGFRRSVFHTAINTPNLWSRSAFGPSLRSSTDLRDLNSWGG